MLILDYINKMSDKQLVFKLASLEYLPNHPERVNKIVGFTPEGSYHNVAISLSDRKYLNQITKEFQDELYDNFQIIENESFESRFLMREAASFIVETITTKKDYKLAYIYLEGMAELKRHRMEYIVLLDGNDINLIVGIENGEYIVYSPKFSLRKTSDIPRLIDISETGDMSTIWAALDFVVNSKLI